MSKQIPTLGKVWLIILLILQVLGAISTLTLYNKSVLYIALAGVAAIEAILIFLLLKGKGKTVFIAFLICHFLNAALTLYLQDIVKEANMVVPLIIGTIIGLAINYGLTYLSVKNTLTKKVQ